MLDVLWVTGRAKKKLARGKFWGWPYFNRNKLGSFHEVTILGKEHPVMLLLPVNIHH
jgi:hypothetical protein